MSALEKLTNIVNSLQNIAQKDKEIMIKKINDNIIDKFSTEYLQAKDLLRQDVTNFKEKKIQEIRQEFLDQNIHLSNENDELKLKNAELKLQNDKLKSENDKLKSEYINLKYENTNYLTLLQKYYGKELEKLKNERQDY